MPQTLGKTAFSGWFRMRAKINRTVTWQSDYYAVGFT